MIFRFSGKYYIVDWKTNYLKDGYGLEQLQNEMDYHNYKMQYIIYTESLIRWLKVKVKDFDYDTHFGGVFYLFVRGINPNNNDGIYFTKPAKSSLSCEV